MAMRSVVIMLIWMMLWASSVSNSTPVAAEANDEAALLAFKAAAIGGGYDDPLASWNNSTVGGFCSWEGVRCGRRHWRVVALILPFHGLNGVLSPAVGNLSFLRVLNLTNNEFIGEIPAGLGHLRRLQYLNLAYNAFFGELPVNLTSCTSLTKLGLNHNHLHGRIPNDLGNKLTHLQRLVLWGNNLTGTIPTSLANLSSLSGLDLSDNQLEGTIPPSLGGILGLQFLFLSYNHLSGEPPQSLYNLSSLEYLEIEGNMLHGGIPTNIGSRFPKMQSLIYAANQFTGSIPASLSNLTSLQFLALTQNMFTGYVPSTLGGLRAMQHLLLDINMLQANDNKGWEFISSLSNCSQLQYLVIGENINFAGQMPSSIGNLSTTLQVLALGNTRISGSIPSTISNLVGLESLHAMNTSLSGMIPESIGRLGNLVELFLYNTFLSGLVPSSIGNISNLIVLKAGHGNLEGAIPASLGNLKNLIELDLSNNRLNGSIPREIFKLLFVSRALDLSHNLLSGPLPSEVGSLGNLNILILSGNQLSGEIPDTIRDCTVLQQLLLDNNSFEGSIPQSLNNIKSLTTLNLSMNNLSGIIPASMGSIHSLQQLYLAHNNLSGPIPQDLQNLTSLSELDLSFNKLQGVVPEEGIFRNSTRFSITGNNELCGGIPRLHLAPCHTDLIRKNRKRKLKLLTIALATTGALLFLVVVVALIQFNHKKLRPKQEGPFLRPIFEEQYERISYQSLENGTDGFSEANLLGKGSFGAVYKCTFENLGTAAAVKVFNLEQARSSRSFMTECEALRRVRHRCLIKIITCCSSINHQGEEFRALVFELMPNGSLDDWLHPKSSTPTISNTLSLEQRLNIAVDIMDALDYLHNHCQPSIVHCDLKPSNILLAEDMSARVGDFGISRILLDSASKNLQNSSSTIGIRGSVGYVAPEYGEGSSISILGDIYSLGILMLEMFTGRSPIDDMFQGPFDLHKYSDYILPERIWEIADTTMWLHTDANDISSRNRIQNCLVSAISLGISCSKKQPRERIPIQDAAVEMHAIRDSYLTFVRSLVLDHGVATTLQ